MMRCTAVLVGLMIAAPARGQLETTTYTRPIVPSLRDLDRLNLNLAWKEVLPVENRGDGLATFQIIDGQIMTQTRSNVVVVLDEVTGDEVWRMSMPKRNVPVFPLAANRNMVLVVNGPRLYVLDRKDGKMKYHVDLPSTVASGLAADNHQCFVVLSNNRLIAIGLDPEDVRRGFAKPRSVDIPDPPTGLSVAPQETGELSTTSNIAPSLTLLRSLKPPYNYYSRDVSPSLALAPTLRNPYRIQTGNRAPSIAMMSNLSKLAEYSEITSDDKPRILWELLANRRIEQAPLIYGEFLILAGADRSVFVVDKYAQRQNRIRHEYLADSGLSAPMVQYGRDLYFCVADGNVYWVEIENFRNNDVPVKHTKRFLSGVTIDRHPIVTGDSLFLSSSAGGVFCLDRKKFEKVWMNPEVDRVWAVNRNVVYAGDRRGNLVVLDRARGLTLATLDVSTFNFPIVNNTNDRLFLGSNSGMLLGLNDRSFRRAELLRPNEPPAPADQRDILNQPIRPPVAPEPKKEPEIKKDP